MVGQKIEKDEKSIRLVAKNSTALVTRTEKVAFTAGSTYDTLLTAVESGKAPDSIKVDKKYTITKNIEEVMEVLANAGLLQAVDIKTTISMTADKFKSTQRRGSVQKAIKECGQISPSFKIKYEIKE